MTLHVRQGFDWQFISIMTSQLQSCTEGNQTFPPSPGDFPSSKHNTADLSTFLSYYFDDRDVCKYLAIVGYLLTTYLLL